jgi:hypothetical protein
MAAYGMDVEQARRLANAVQLHSDDIARLAETVTRRVDALDWYGPDADKFRSDMWPVTAVQLQSVQKAAVALSQTTDANLRDQIRVSGV